ncbi:MAG: restriction endonuclease subunit S [Ignavibacteria bacterium]|nr:restriction endonuclease subunit S [Ignavibacteria bacterium]
MSNRTITVKDVCDLNFETIGNTSQPRIIKYLDTGSITRNRIDKIQQLDRSIEPFPSRAQRKVKNETIIYSTVRPIQEHFGFLIEPDNNLIVSTGFLTIDVKDKDIEPKFLYYVITQKGITNYLQTIATNNVSSYPSINPDDLGNLKFNIPYDKNVQQRIAAVLSALDAKIELNNRINAELEAMAKTLYDYWFVQFDFPDKNGKPYKSSGGKMVWNAELKREIPMGWESAKMSEWIDIDKSGDWGKAEPEGKFTLKVTCFRGADINGLNGLDELKPPVRYIHEKNAFKILKSHDLIIEISGGSPTQSTGRLAFITDATIKRFENPIICSNFCRPVSMKNNKLLYNFAYYWNSLYENGVFFGYEGKTSGIKNLLLDSFVNSYFTVVPETDIVNQFYDFMENIQEKKQTALAENQNLIELRGWLLPMLMNGQVRVH